MYEDSKCPTCGWDSLEDDGLEKSHCKIINSQKTMTEWGPGADYNVECTCPKCGQIFGYADGYP